MLGVITIQKSKKFKGATTLEPHPSLKLLKLLQDDYTVDITTSINF